ncbi:hypothetical protein A6E15_17705 [Natrinema saccharevitans]|uniref:Ferric oxidoreductase domain-containing protein n=1 Tax=Natrinema saccharevitans TaxID=301967 RepID=A0A1S8ART1_9EURY|nr:hypothetical protein [Natrinema saccharevitans]OLZ39241.1 hypothetical protein A6E15_17705 [Natrinema saccharevitans]
MEIIWHLDRSAALVAYPALYLAVLTGILYTARSFGPLYRLARKIHIEVSVFAMLVTLLHGVLGVLDTWFIVTGSAPQPAYSTTYLLAGVVVGVGALQVLAVAALGFLDAERFDRPWGPRIVHAFAYGGFAFATVHAAAVGTDVAGLIRPVFGPAILFLTSVLLLRLLAARKWLSTPATTKQ